MREGSLEVADEFAAVVDAEFVENGAEMGAYGVDAHAEVGGDVFVAEAVEGEMSATEFGWSEEVEWEAFFGFGDAADADADVGRNGLICRGDDGEGGLKAFDGGMAADCLESFDRQGRVREGLAELSVEAL